MCLSIILLLSAHDDTISPAKSSREDFMRIGFDNTMYISMQAERIRQRISEFGGKLYLEFGGKLLDDNHASRVLPGFEPDSKA